MRDTFGHKPRTHRKQARQQFLAVAKKKKPRINKIRKVVRQQLDHLRHNLASIDALTACGASLLTAGQYTYQKLLVASRTFLTSLTAEVSLTASSAFAKFMSGRSCVVRQYGIRLSGLRLSRSKSDPELLAEEKPPVPR